jgi:Mrp family chromosome partitioning ATPase/uncharacterized protein involved in exopolysaccharide biosynthesis
MTNGQPAKDLPASVPPATRLHRIPTPGEAIGLIARRFWIVLLLAGLGGGLGFVGARLFHPVYQAVAIIKLKNPSKAKVGEANDDSKDVDPAEATRRLSAGLTARATVDALIAKHKQKFPPEQIANKDKLHYWLTSYIQVLHRAGPMYEVSGRARDPELARLIVTDLAEKALVIHRADHEQQAIRMEEFARKQVEEVEEKLKKLTGEMVDFLEKHPIMKLKSLSSDQLNLQDSDRMRAQGRNSALSASLNKLADKNPKVKELVAKKRRLEAELKSLTESGTSATSELSRALTEAKSQLAERRAQNLKDDHPLVKQVLRRIQDLEKQIASSAPGKQTADSKHVEKVRAELKKVDAELRSEVKGLASALPAPKVDIRTLETEWSRMRSEYTALNDQLAKLQEVEVNASLQKNLALYEASKMATIVERPRAPDSPTGLTRPIIIAAAGIAFFVFGLLAALGIGILDTRLLRPEHVARANARFEILAVLENHPMRHVKQAERIRHQELMVDGEGGERKDGEGLIHWLRGTDDLDQTISLLKAAPSDAAQAAQGEGGEGEESPWNDAAPTAFFDKNAPHALGQQAKSTALALRPAGGSELVLRGEEAVASLPQPKIRTVAAKPPLAPGLFVSTDPRSKQAEQMRLLAARLEKQIGNALRVVAVTSWEPGVGKTTVAANLAMVLAESQKRVLAIDACPGSAALTRTFGIEPDGVGIYEQLQRWLDGKGSPWEVVQIAETLTILPSSSSEKPALPLLSSEAFTRLVNDMLQIFDALIVDTSALSVASDAVVLQKRVDGYLVVAGRGRTRTRGIQQIASRLDPSRILGTVFNERG